MTNQTNIMGSELMHRKNGSIYHLNLKPGELAETIILVGDPSRVSKVSKYFDRIELRRRNREFVTHTGYIGNFRISVMSTGIGVDNIDIVINEVDALFNIDFASRSIKKNLTHLKFLRLGTCGAASADIPVNQLVLTTSTFGFDGLLGFYQHELNPYEENLLKAIKEHFADLPAVGNAYVAEGSLKMVDHFRPYCLAGITLTCAGFYGPQRRTLRAPLIKTNILELAESFNYKNEKVANLEMETSALYALGRVLSHECCTIDTVVANRITHEVSKVATTAVDNMIKLALEKVVAY